MNEAKIEILSGPLHTTPQKVYSVNIGTLNGSTPSYLVSNNETGVHEYISQVLPEALKAADALEQELLQVRGLTESTFVAGSRKPGIN